MDLRTLICKQILLFAFSNNLNVFCQFLLEITLLFTPKIKTLETPKLIRISQGFRIKPLRHRNALLNSQTYCILSQRQASRHQLDHYAV